MFENRSDRFRAVLAASATVLGVAIVAMGGIAIAAQDRFTVQVPNGLSFSEFRGYEKWQMIGVSQSGNLIEVILGNPTMIEGYEAGIPGNGKHFPDGAKMAKIHWNTTKNAEGFPITVPDTLHDIDFMVKDSKRFADSGGWGFAAFEYSPASDTFRPGNATDMPPQANDAKCGFACHTVAAAKDYVFTPFPKR